MYKSASLTSVLDSDPATARAGVNANEIMIPKLSMDGLAEYSRNDGYIKGDVSLEWETVKFNYDRGRLFEVDSMDAGGSGSAVAVGRRRMILAAADGGLAVPGCPRA